MRNDNDVQKKRTSDLLQDILNSSTHVPITIGDFVASLGDRSFALAILIFSLPNSLPIPGIPGFSTITGLPILWLALQIIWGRQTIWLPNTVHQKQFSQVMLAKVIHKALPVVLKLEKWICPRWSFLCASWCERVIGLLILAMALILVLPIVGGNFLPGFSISLLALALLEKDGIFALASAFFTLGSLYFMYHLVVFIMQTAFTWLMGMI